jgi:hypothetical protein
LTVEACIRKKWSALTLPKSHGGMGFGDIKKFNLSMLGKQGWRLMTNPSSLCAQVLKDKYCPNRDFMTESKKKNVSHTLRMGKSVLEIGLIRRIGNGTSTNIWNDRWIANVIGMKPICR